MGGCETLTQRVAMRTLLQDLRFGSRMLLRNPALTAVAVLALTLGIGANTAIFSVVYGILLRPLPYREPDRLAQILLWSRQRNTGTDVFRLVNAVDLRELKQVFEHVIIYRIGPHFVDFSGEGPRSLWGTAVTPGTFEALGVQPALGRPFLAEEGTPGRDQVIVLSHRYWQERFASDPTVLGKVITFRDYSSGVEKGYEVVGVMPASFAFPEGYSVRFDQFWVPLALSAKDLQDGAPYVTLVARLKTAVTFTQAQPALGVLSARLAQRDPRFQGRGYEYRLVPLQEHLVGKVRPVLSILFGAVCFVLLIACVNVANLLLARMAARQHEVAVRASLGAGRLRLIRQFLTESILLSVLGGLAGVLLAYWAVQALRAILPSDLPRLSEIHVDASVLSFGLVLSLLTGTLAGLAPAIQLSKPDLNQALKLGGAFSSGSRAGPRLQNWLMGFETALAFVLLIGAGLLIKSFRVLQDVNLGFNPKKVLTVRMVNASPERSQPSQLPGFYAELGERIQAIPGVEKVGFVDCLPLTRSKWTHPVRLERWDSPPTTCSLHLISGDYFQALQIPLIAGRRFSAPDNPNSSVEALINQRLAQKLFGSRDPIGARLMIFSTNAHEIVGIVGNVRHSGLEGEEEPEAYIPLPRKPEGYLGLVVRTSGEPMLWARAVRQAILSMNRNEPVDAIVTMDRLLADRTAPRRFNTILAGVFAGLALALAAIGIYGVVSNAVTRRTREIGIRMALGADRVQVVKSVLAQGMAATLIGLLVGGAAAFALTRVMASLLFRVSKTDPLTFAGVFLLLLAVAFLANYVPARRATKVDPMAALRYE